MTDEAIATASADIELVRGNDIRIRRRWIGFVPNFAFFFIVLLFMTVFCRSNQCSVGDAIAVSIVFFGVFNSFFVISLVLFDVWWFGRGSRVLLVLSVAAFAVNSLFWVAGILSQAG